MFIVERWRRRRVMELGFEINTRSVRAAGKHAGKLLRNHRGMATLQISQAPAIYPCPF